MMPQPQQEKQQRVYAEQVPEWQRFQTTALAPTFVANVTSGSAGSYEAAAGNSHHGYQRQYAHVYHQRLEILSKVLLSRSDGDTINDVASATADAADSNNQQGRQAQVVLRILELPEEVLVTCVGTLVKETSDRIKLAEAKFSDFSYYLEDESGRVAVSFDSLVPGSTDNGANAISPTSPEPEPVQPLSPLHLCTGLVIRVTGVVGTDGVLCASAITTAASVTTVPPALRNQQSSITAAAGTQPPHLLLLSGLECGSDKVSSLPRDMLISYIQGLFGHKAPAVAHIVLAGGLVAPTAVVDGCRDLDSWVCQLTLASGVPVTVMPGQDDPTTAQWPQRPLHSSLLPHSSKTALTSRSPNPYAATFRVPVADTSDLVDADPTLSLSPGPFLERLVVGTDGTNVKDFMKQTLGLSELDALRHTLTHQHICPTGPDTVPTMPHAHADPMLLASSWPQQPSLYFAGNASRFETELVSVHTPHPNSDGDFSMATTTCRLVCIPKFIETGMAVLVNMDTLAVELLKFDDSNLE